MTTTERWVRRLYHFNMTQLALNTILLFLLGTWYVGLPTEEDANRTLEEESLPIADLPDGAFNSLGAPETTTAAKAPAAAAADSEEDPAINALLAGAPEGEGSEAVAPGVGDAPPESGALPGTGGKGAAPASTGPINTYLEKCSVALRRLGVKTGKNVSPYLPTSEQWAAAVGTGDFFNAKTITVLERLKEGFIATGGKMPPLPEDAGEDAPFNPAY